MSMAKLLAAAAICGALSGCMAAPETSSRFYFSPSYAPLPGTD
jgi:hypothetical protein